MLVRAQAAAASGPMAAFSDSRSTLKTVEDLQKHITELEERLALISSELMESNRRMQEETATRMRAEKALRDFQASTGIKILRATENALLGAWKDIEEKDALIIEQKDRIRLLESELHSTGQSVRQDGAQQPESADLAEQGHISTERLHSELRMFYETNAEAGNITDYAMDYSIACEPGPGSQEQVHEYETDQERDEKLDNSGQVREQELPWMAAVESVLDLVDSDSYPDAALEVRRIEEQAAAAGAADIVELAAALISMLDESEDRIFVVRKLIDLENLLKHSGNIIGRPDSE